MRYHTLAAAEFDDLSAGYGTPAGIRELCRAQTSRRTLLLHLISSGTGAPSRTGHRLWPAYRLLSDAQERDPGAVSRMLAEPHVGAWLAAAYQESSGAGTPAVGAPGGPDRPNRLDHLNNVAAAAAIRAGMDFLLEVPATNGGVMLPGLGRARVGEPVVAVSGKAGEYRVGDVTIPDDPSADGPSWLGLHELSSEVDGCRLSVRLDDLDPYRARHGLDPAGRLGAPEVARWQGLLDEAWAILVRHHRRYAEGIAAGLRTVVPLNPLACGDSVNATSMYAFGAVMLSPPADRLAFASSLLHEWQHGKLGALLDIVPLYEDDGARRHYVPWRDDPRPLGGAVQGAYAFLGVTDFWRVQRRVLDDGSRRRFAQVEFARWREQVWRTVGMLEATDRFTPHGRRFLARMRASLAPWMEQPVPDEVAALATETAADHRTAWRLRNLRPAPESVRALADAWRERVPAPTGPVPCSVVPGDVRARAGSTRTDLSLLRLSDPGTFSSACARPSELVRVAPGATAGDAAYAAEDFAAAIREYRSQTRDEPDDSRHWTGLALAARRLGGAGTPAWWDSPEVPFAVHRRLREAGVPAPDPLDLATWLAGGAGGSTGGRVAPGAVDPAPAADRPASDQVGGGSTTQ